MNARVHRAIVIGAFDVWGAVLCAAISFSACPAAAESGLLAQSVKGSTLP
jgi:hypothetical protein